MPLAFAIARSANGKARGRSTSGNEVFVQEWYENRVMSYAFHVWYVKVPHLPGDIMNEPELYETDLKPGDITKLKSLYEIDPYADVWLPV